MNYVASIVLTVMVVLLSGSTFAAAAPAAPPRATVLFDFESDYEIAVWHDEKQSSLDRNIRLERDRRFAASGKYSLKFSTPAWRPEDHGGERRWPAFMGRPPVTDWSRFDRLVMEVVNATGCRQTLGLFVTDSQTAIRKGPIERVVLAPWSHTQFVMSLRGEFERCKVDPKDVQIMHFFLDNPQADVTLYIDRVMLLEPGEKLPSLPAAYLADFGALQLGQVELLQKRLAEADRAAGQLAADSPGAADWMSGNPATLRKRLSDAAEDAARGDASALNMTAALDPIRGDVARTESLLAFQASFEKVRRTIRTKPGVSDGVAVGFASSMQKVMPRGPSLSLEAKARVEVSLARNERESFQTVVVPFGRDLKRVQVRVGDLRAKDGRVFAAANVEAVAVGYVQTKSTPPYGSEHVGWWPDPILNFLTTVDIRREDAQAFWVRVRAPKAQAPGVYEGVLEVAIDGTVAFSFDLAVRVYAFALPDESPLPMAITFTPDDVTSPEARAEALKFPGYPTHAWRKHKSQWVDFLADYYITYDNLYGTGEWTPDFAELKRLHEQGRLGRFNLGYYDMFGDKEADAKKWLARARTVYDKAKELGLLDHAYIYGCDEAKAELFPQVERTAAMIKAAFPDVTVMTTTMDPTCGLGTGMKSIDAWCPLTQYYDAATAARARAAGKQVWWYICCVPHHPYANMFVEYPAIGGRLLMGAMTAKYRPDGFLYYQTAIWRGPRCIESGPFTDWEPLSWTTYHGDGSWTCAGPDGTPLPTIRLENFRDGLEDYAYVRILEATVAKVEATPELAARQAEWLAKAKALLVVPADVVQNLVAYTRDPAALYRWRNRLAEAVESAGADPEDPWAKPKK